MTGRKAWGKSTRLCSTQAISANASSAPRAIELLCPEGQSLGEDWNKQSDEQFPKSRFEYLPKEDAYRCPNQQMLTPCGRYRGSATSPGYTEYGTTEFLSFGLNVDLIKKGSRRSGSLAIIGRPVWRHQCTGGERANPPNLRQLAARRILTVLRLNLTLQFLDLPVQCMRMLAQSLQ